MTRVIVLVAVVALCACGPSLDVTAAQEAEREIGSAQLPFDHSTGFLDGYSLRVTAEGGLLWNGASVTDATLKDYLNQWSELPRTAGGLFVAFEPGLLPSRAKWVRRQVMDSGLCEQRRCWEVGWNVKRPVVS